jgi:riboflavin kinase
MTQDLPILLELARAGAHKAPHQLTTGELASRLGVSQPTAARKLAALQRRGLITRELGPRGQKVRLTSAGLATLRSVHKELDAILEEKPRVLELSGQVVSGVGEGSYYIGQEGYRKQFKRELGFDPCPGTLDLKLDEASLELRATLLELPSKQIEGFSTPERTFGPVKCFPATLRGAKVAVVLPSRSHYSDLIELIAPRNLRRSLKLSDGDAVKVKVMI